jgi:hypothetical protein
MAAPSKVWVCSRSLAGIAGSNPARGMDLSLVSVVWCQVDMPLRRADHTSTGVLLSMTCLTKCVLENLNDEEAKAHDASRAMDKKYLWIQALLNG